MIDVVAAIVLTALSAATAGALILTAPLEPASRRRLAVFAAAWLAVAAGLSAAGLFASRLGTPAIGVFIVGPIVLALATARSPLTRRLALGIPVAVLIAVNVGRLLGVFFLMLEADGRLSRTFATSAGWGDIMVGVLALPLAWLVHRRGPGWRPLALVWSALGFLDLVMAVTLGIGSQPAFPLRFIFETPGTALLARLPWLVIPGFLVPVYLLTHLAVFAQLAAVAGRRAWPGRTSRAAGKTYRDWGGPITVDGRS